jgi:hypothetical protein
MMYLQKFGFREDPFQSTNAADEPQISEYFVPPPYFTSVVGDPSQPKSQVILAPRGGGKTAQRVMLEQSSRHSKEYLCVTYDEFLVADGAKLDGIDLNYHLRNVNELLTLSILLDCASEGYGKENLDEHKVGVLKQAVEIYLGAYSQNLHSSAIGKFKNLGDKAGDLWDKYGGKLSLLVNGVLAYLGVGAVDLSSLARNPENYNQSHQFYLSKLGEIAIALGYKSVYVLIDRVDEMHLTSSDAEKSYRFIRPLISDLHILETKHVAFKFFLWDQVKEFYIADGARPDRIKIYNLNWSVSEISRMLTERMRSFSGGAVDNLDQIVQADIRSHLLVSHVASGSPRDLIRVCGRVVDEQTRTAPENEKITARKFWEGVENFCNERAEELYARHIPDIRRIGALNFTNRMLANDVFRVTENAIRPKIQAWQNAGAVARIGEVPNPGNRPLYLYGIADLRLSVSALRNIGIDEIFGNFLLICPRCDALNICDRDGFTCACGSAITLGQAKSIYKVCSE